MAAITDVTLTAGVPTAGTGTVSTLDKFNGTAGSSTTQVLTVQGVASGTALPVSVATIPSHAVTNAGTFATQSAQSGTWTVQPGNTANTTAWKVDGSAVTQPVSISGNQAVNVAQVAGTTAATGSGVMGAGTQRVALATDSPGIIATGTAGTPSATVLTVQGVTSMTPLLATVTNVPLTNFGAGEYETVAASQTAQALGATGATGDYLQGLLVIPATTSPGLVTVLDNATSIPVFVGGASSVSNLIPFFIPLGTISVSGAWKVTTGANVSVIGIGNFT